MAVSDQTVLSGTQLDTLSINTIRTLAIDGVQKANSGHPGAPMALAPVAYVLWQQFLRYDPENPIWPNRDRFVLSNGHASMLLYAMLHLAGVRAVNSDYDRLDEYAVTLDDIKQFRQANSKTPGHPEYRITTGVETTTGPLGQGIGNSVGMAIAGNWLAANYNQPGFDVFDYNVFAMCGDGDMMEGVGCEAASLAGHLKLSNLCWIYDHNSVTLDGPAKWSFNEDVMTKFVGLGWNVTRVADANDLTMLGYAYETFLKTNDRPTLIVVDSHIGYGSPNKHDSSDSHGEPLGVEEVKLTKKFYGWPEDAQFLVPDGVREHFAANLGERGRALRETWMEHFGRYREEHPDLADQLLRMQRRELPDGWDAEIPEFPPDEKGLAGRESSGKVLNAIAEHHPWLLGGAADLAPSTKTALTFDGAGSFSRDDRHGRNFHFGVREHAMSAAVNGLALSKLRPFGSGFLIFSDYARAPIRLSALMEIPTIHIFTHDSIGVGEDGPTHQPIEQLASLRAMPALITIRPGDANEVAEAWRLIMELKHDPAVLVLSRGPMRTLDRSVYAPASGVRRGAYVLADPEDGDPDVIIMATGTEVQLAVAAFEQLSDEGVRARVVSMPSWNLFERQDEDYREQVLPRAITARVGVEQASDFGWDRYVGPSGTTIAMRSFGMSAPLKDLQQRFGFTPEAVADAARAQLERG